MSRRKNKNKTKLLFKCSVSGVCNIYDFLSVGSASSGTLQLFKDLFEEIMMKRNKYSKTIKSSVKEQLRLNKIRV